jgi:flagellar basal-body rod modification protein FlgD
MDSVNNTGSNPALDNLRWQNEGVKPTTVVNGNDLGQEDFYKLLTTQLSMQDPLKPTTNEDMIAQMTTFTMAEGITSLGDKMDQLTASMTSNQALEASSLVGRNVLVNSSVAHSDGSGIEGRIPVKSDAQSVVVRVTDEKGAVVRAYSMGDQDKGMMEFKWDGKDKDGKVLPEGKYQIKATGLIDGKSEEFPILTYGNVSSVTLGQNGTGLELNLQGLGAIKLSDVLAVGD